MASTQKKGTKRKRGLKELPTLKKEDDEPAKSSSYIPTEVATALSELEASAVRSMELSKALIDAWGVDQPRLTNAQLRRFRLQFEEMHRVLRIGDKPTGRKARMPSHNLPNRVSPPWNF